MGLDCSMLWRGGKSSQAVGTAGLFGACHRDASRERRRAAALSRFAALQRVRVSPKNRGSVNAALVSNRRKAVPRSRRCCSAVSSAGVVVAIMGVGVDHVPSCSVGLAGSRRWRGGKSSKLNRQPLERQACSAQAVEMLFERPEKSKGESRPRERRRAAARSRLVVLQQLRELCKVPAEGEGEGGVRKGVVVEKGRRYMPRPGDRMTSKVRISSWGHRGRSSREGETQRSASCGRRAWKGGMPGRGWNVD